MVFDDETLLLVRRALLGGATNLHRFLCVFYSSLFSVRRRYTSLRQHHLERLLHRSKCVSNHHFLYRQKNKLILQRCVRVRPSLPCCHTSLSPCVVSDQTKTQQCFKHHPVIDACVHIRFLLDHRSNVHRCHSGEVRSKFSSIFH